MREVEGRHTRHGGDVGPDAFPRHARDGRQPRPEVVHDSAARRTSSLEYQRRVEAEFAAYHGRHAKSPDTSVDRVPAPSADRPAGRIAERELPRDERAEKRGKPQRSWLPSNEATQVAVSVDALFSAVNNSYQVIPGKIEGIAAAGLVVVAAGIAWANKRWKDNHGDRSQG
jgi:hypothetical protein